MSELQKELALGTNLGSSCLSLLTGLFCILCVCFWLDPPLPQRDTAGKPRPLPGRAPVGRGWAGAGAERGEERRGGEASGGHPSLCFCRSGSAGLGGARRCSLSLPLPRAAGAAAWDGSGTHGGRPAGGLIGRSGNEPRSPRWHGVLPGSSVTEGDLPPVQDPPGLASKRPPPEVPSLPPAFGDTIFGARRPPLSRQSPGAGGHHGAKCNSGVFP